MNPDEEKAACEAPEEVKASHMQGNGRHCLVKLMAKLHIVCWVMAKLLKHAPCCASRAVSC